MRLGRRRLAAAGCSIPQIAAITAHSIKMIETILDRYLIRTGGLARTALQKRLDKERKDQRV